MFDYIDMTKRRHMAIQSHNRKGISKFIYPKNNNSNI